MSTMNLSPKNPIVVVALAGAAIWMLSRRRATGATARPAPVGTTINGTVAPALEALGAVLNIFRSPGSAQGVPDESARAAVRAGDPYYGGSNAINGSTTSWLDQVAQDAAAWDMTDYYTGSTGDPYNPDGGYWLN